MPSVAVRRETSPTNRSYARTRSTSAGTRRLPCFHEQIDLVPAVEADAETAVLQNLVHLGEGRTQPSKTRR